MRDRIVSTRFHQLDRVLCLNRPQRGTGTSQRGTGIPAVLAIPRGGLVREPQLALFAHHFSRSALVDTHVVVRADVARSEVADVLVGPDFLPSADLRRMLARYPGCGVAVSRRPNGHFAVSQDGSAVATRCSSQADEVWAPICGSFLYCWSVGGLALAELARMVLIVGRFTVPCSLETVGRVQVTAVHAAPGGRRLAS